PLGAGDAEAFLAVAPLEVDLAVVEAMVEVLPGIHHVAELAVAAHLVPDPPAGLVEVEAAGQGVLNRVEWSRFGGHGCTLSGSAGDGCAWMPQTSSVQGTSRGREAAMAL